MSIIAKSIYDGSKSVNFFPEETIIHRISLQPIIIQNITSYTPLFFPICEGSKTKTNGHHQTPNTVPASNLESLEQLMPEVKANQSRLN